MFQTQTHQPKKRLRKKYALLPSLCTVAPLCRLGQIQTYNIARQETAKIVCELESNPNDVHFTWKFNTSSAENLDLPASLIAVDRAKSIAHYTPMTEQVRDTLVYVYICMCIVCSYVYMMDGASIMKANVLRSLRHPSVFFLPPGENFAKFSYSVLQCIH